MKLCEVIETQNADNTNTIGKHCSSCKTTPQAILYEQTNVNNDANNVFLLNNLKSYITIETEVHM